MSTECTRSITFTIPGINKSPAVNVNVVEMNGTLVFTLDVVSKSKLPADLDGLFFNFNNPQLLSGLTYTGNDVSVFDTINVIDLGHGVNLYGAARPFDVGLAFGTPGIGLENITSTTFTLSNPNGNLTLDDIANVEFGARLSSLSSKGGGAGNPAKLLTTAPAAPDAVDDTYTIFEDGQPNLNSPSHTPAATLFEVLANDTDADGDTLTITRVSEPLHGTVEIVDGADANALPGDALLYTPDADYSGDESFIYCISDNNGGTDFATVSLNVTAVADVPDLAYEILAGDSVNQMIIRVNTSQTDADGSEYIDRIELNGIPASGVSISETTYRTTGEPDAVTAKDFILTLDKEMDFDFDLTLTSVAKERSNADEETKSEIIAISYNKEDNDFQTTFKAEEQSMWNTGDAFQWNDDRFFGVNNPSVSEYGSVDVLGGTAYASVYGNYKFGLESSLYIDGGLVDAEAPFSANIDTYYNHTTDWLRIETDAFNYINDSWFSTSSPNLNYDLDLIGDFDLNFTMGANVSLHDELWEKVGEEWIDGFWASLTEWISGYWEDIFDWVPYDFSFGDSISFHPDFNWDLDLLTFDGEKIYFGPEGTSELFSDTAEWDLGNYFTLQVQAPHIDTASSVLDSNTLSAHGTTGDGEDKNFVSLVFDVDKALSSLAGLPFNPLGDSVEFGPGDIFEVGYDILNYELSGVLDLGQNFFMDINDLAGRIVFEDGSLVNFIFGDDLDFFDASDLDANQDGYVEYNILLSPEAQFYSDLFLNPHLDHLLEIAKLYGSIKTPWPFSNVEVELGPVATPVDGELWGTDIELVGMPKFDFAFESQGFEGLIA